MVKFFTKARPRLFGLVKEQLQSVYGTLAPKKIVIKPNWVVHQDDPLHPIEALITDPCLIDAVVHACLEVFPECEQITVADCPLQSADWPLMCEQSGLSDVIQRVTGKFGNRVRFLDLRQDVVSVGMNHKYYRNTEDQHGDPLGYCEIDLKDKSHLESISDQSDRFSLADYSASVTRKHHCRGTHEYFVGRTYLSADLFINLPKWKTHSKTALTGALKNLVGINGDKAYLPHYRRGCPRWGGDEYCDADRWLVWVKTVIHQLVFRHSSFFYRLLRPCWKAIEAVHRVMKRGVPDSRQSLYVAGGGWYGNQTIWRMIYDLNMIIQCCDLNGVLRPEPQRAYFCVVDGLIAGDGEGPLKPQPRNLDCVVFGDDPFEIDAVLGHLMGFDTERMPILANRFEYMGSKWGKHENETLPVLVDGECKTLLATARNYLFRSPLGWLNHIERPVHEAEVVDRATDKSLVSTEPSAVLFPRQHK